MGDPTSSRPRRSRVGLFLFLLLLGAAAWELASRISDSPGLRPSRMLAGALGGGGGGNAGPPDAPSASEMERMYIEPQPYVMWGLKPKWTRESKRGLVMTSNSLGFRGEEIAVPKPAGVYRIVCLGGSTTYDELVSDADTFAVQLQAALRKARPDRKIEVVNAGVPSYTSAESLANLAFRCIELQPDLILDYDNVNDVRPRFYRNFDNAYFNYRKIWDGSNRLWQKGEGELESGINLFLQRLPPDDNGDQASNARRAGTHAFERNLTSIAGIAKAHGIDVAFATVICDPQDPNAQAPLIDGIVEQNEVMKRVAAAQGALLIDLAAQFPKGDYFDDPVHNNPAGAKEKARIIADGLLAGPLK